MIMILFFCGWFILATLLIPSLFGEGGGVEFVVFLVASYAMFFSGIAIIYEAITNAVKALKANAPDSKDVSPKPPSV